MKWRNTDLKNKYKHEKISFLFLFDKILTTLIYSDVTINNFSTGKKLHQSLIEVTVKDGTSKMYSMFYTAQKDSESTIEQLSIT